MKREWVRITISVRRSTANRVLRVKRDYNLTYEELFKEYVRLKSMVEPTKKQPTILRPIIRERNSFIK